VRVTALIISPHGSGFWQADVYIDGWQEGGIPDWYCTGSLGGSRQDTIDKGLKAYPDAKVMAGITGICMDCSSEHFALESQCVDCDGCVADT
jgi:hypothetical protein